MPRDIQSYHFWRSGLNGECRATLRIAHRRNARLRKELRLLRKFLQFLLEKSESHVIFAKTLATFLGLITGPRSVFVRLPRANMGRKICNNNTFGEKFLKKLLRLLFNDKCKAMSTFKERLMCFAKTQYGEGQKAFEERCGMSNGQINKMGNGANSTTLSKIAEICPQLNLRWLILGEGKMLSGANEESYSQSLPLIPIEAFAGPGEFNYEDERIENYYTVSDFKESDFLIRVKGDSMVPKYNGGDIVACKKVDMDRLFFLQWGRVYVIYTRSQGAMIKRLQPSEKDGWIKCVSENDKYAPFDVPTEDVVSVALVNGSISLE